MTLKRLPSGGPCPPEVVGASMNPLKWVKLITCSLGAVTPTRILHRSRTPPSGPGMLTKVREITSFFMLLELRAGGPDPGGTAAPVGRASPAEPVLCLRHEGTRPPFIIKFESFNKIKQPEKCSCWQLKSTKGITVLQKGSEASARGCVKGNKTSGGKLRLSPLCLAALPPSLRLPRALPDPDLSPHHLRGSVWLLVPHPHDLSVS